MEQGAANLGSEHSSSMDRWAAVRLMATARMGRMECIVDEVSLIQGNERPNSRWTGVCKQQVDGKSSSCYAGSGLAYKFSCQASNQ